MQIIGWILILVVLLILFRRGGEYFSAVEDPEQYVNSTLIAKY